MRPAPVPAALPATRPAMPGLILAGLPGPLPPAVAAVTGPLTPVPGAAALAHLGGTEQPAPAAVILAPAALWLGGMLRAGAGPAAARDVWMAEVRAILAGMRAHPGVALVAGEALWTWPDRLWPALGQAAPDGATGDPPPANAMAPDPLTGLAAGLAGLILTMDSAARALQAEIGARALPLGRAPDPVPDPAEPDAAALDRAWRALRAGAEEATTAAATRDRDLAAARADAARMDSLLRDQTARADGLQDRIAGLSADLARAGAAGAATGAQAARLQDRLTALRTAQGTHRTERQALRRQLAVQAADLARLRRAAAALQGDLAALRGSSSWRLTAPLRRLRQLLPRG